MHVQVKAGNDVKTNETWMAEIGAIVNGTLDRFDRQLTSVEVFIGDENGRAKRGHRDKRCVIEARLAGMKPIAVHTHASTFETAVNECAEKIERTLDRRLGRLADKDGRKS
jgi:ribosome-associated translation inhibitor RaiA